MKPLNCKQWSSEEDEILKDYIQNHGARKWDLVGVDSGLNRTGKSCRLRWLNHLKPGVKKGPFSDHERALVNRMHSQFGSKWSKMAKQLPGRSDNDIKNFWNTQGKRSGAGQDAGQRDGSISPGSCDKIYIHSSVDGPVFSGAGNEARQSDASLPPISYDRIYNPGLWDAIEAEAVSFPSVPVDEPFSLRGISLEFPFFHPLFLV